MVKLKYRPTIEEVIKKTVLQILNHYGHILIYRRETDIYDLAATDGCPIYQMGQTVQPSSLYDTPKFL